MEKLTNYYNKGVLRVILKISPFNHILNWFKHYIITTVNVNIIN